MRRLSHLPLIAASSAAGLLGAHTLAYRLTYTAQGPAHAYLDDVIGPAVGVTVLAALAVFAAGFCRRGSALRYGEVFRALAAMQVVAFVGMESAEHGHLEAGLVLW